MKAAELMIGDLVTFKDCQNDANPIIIKIWQINADGNALAFVDGWNALDEISIDEDVVGIPITSEILEENGFGYIEKDAEITHFYPGERCFCSDMNLHIGTDRKGHFWMNTSRNDIFGLHYVHELQHALRLCGIDKQIEL